nr:hypothetical protein BaRGS_019200 [Batillaria attramentaria]
MPPNGDLVTARRVKLRGFPPARPMGEVTVSSGSARYPSSAGDGPEKVGAFQGVAGPGSRKFVSRCPVSELRYERGRRVPASSTSVCCVH